MAFQVLINFDDMKNTPLNIADSSEEFKKTTVKELKERFRFKVPGAPDPGHLKVFFGNNHLDDHKTLGSYKIQHLSVLTFVMKMPTGKGALQSDPDQQFLQTLLPGLKRMDLKQKELTKFKMQQMVFGAEFHDPNTSGKGIRRTDSMERLPPKM